MATKKFHHPEKADPRDPHVTVFSHSAPSRIELRMPKSLEPNNLWFAIEYGAGHDEFWIDEDHAQRLLIELAKGLAKLDEFKRTHAAGAPAELPLPQP